MASPLEKHLEYYHHLRQALSLAKNSPPKPTNFRVGAILLHTDENRILATGYTLELPGNTHAEQVCLAKIAQEHGIQDEGEGVGVGSVLPRNTTLFTTMEPCWFRLSGNKPCVQRILDTLVAPEDGIRRVVCGVREPEKFVGENRGRRLLEEAGVEVVYVTGLEDEILEVATAGHAKEEKEEEKQASQA